MTHLREIAAGFRVRQKAPDGAVFDLKTRDGTPLGFILNGAQGGPCLVVAGTGPATKSVFQQVLFWPSVSALRGRLALVQLDRLDDHGKDGTLRELAGMLQPVTDTLLLPTGPEADAAFITDARNRVEAFCRRHGCLPGVPSGLDCASM